MITSQLKAGQVLVPPITEYLGIRLKLAKRREDDTWGLIHLVLSETVWVPRYNLPEEELVQNEIYQEFKPEGWLRGNCHRVCECQNHPSPDGVCELAIDDEKWVRNKGFCSWCFHKHSR